MRKQKLIIEQDYLFSMIILIFIFSTCSYKCRMQFIVELFYIMKKGVYPPGFLTKSLIRRILTSNRSSMTTDMSVKLERMARHPNGKEACLNFRHQSFKCLYIMRPKKSKSSQIQRIFFNNNSIFTFSLFLAYFYF